MGTRKVKSNNLGRPRIRNKPATNPSSSVTRANRKVSAAYARTKSKSQCKSPSSNKKRLFLARQLEDLGIYPSEDHRESYGRRTFREVLQAASDAGLEIDSDKYPPEVQELIRCEKGCAYGMEYCLYHGSLHSRNELAANRLFMSMMVTPALRRQLKIITTSRNDQAANTAIKDVLDRNLGKEPLKLEIEDNPAAASLDNLSEEELLTLRKLHHKLRESRGLLPAGRVLNITPGQGKAGSDEDESTNNPALMELVTVGGPGGSDMEE